ncbi:MFS transporter [Komagataeibacter sp. FNDCF1]|uniref:MFS transporter n=1 Tax=Komagataeibacter sp. FNDCF1 TaxID=2878681 RepID=UPI001E3F0B78|nr:MFS transporter [Komagataeibacter sp. FNDCF1]
MDVPPVDTPVRQAVPPRASLRRRLAAHPVTILCVLCLFSLMDSVDQGGLTLVVDRIRRDLALSHVEASFLLGFASMAVSTLVLVPAGILVDMFSRRRLLFGTGCIWAAMSLTSGLARSFWPLFAARAGGAVADGVLKPASQSILRDVFPPERRGIPFSLYWGFFSLGSGISFYLSGSLIHAADHGFFAGWPIIGHFRPWQIVLALPGLCTLPLTALILLIDEPPRAQPPENPPGTPDATPASIAETFTFLRQYWWLYWPSLAYSVVWSVPNAGFLWTPSVLTESWTIPEAEIGHMIGTLGIAMSLVGTLGGGALVDMITRRAGPDAAIRITLVASALMAFVQTLILHVSTHAAIFTLIGMMFTLQGTINASYYVAIAAITPGRFMGRMFALQFLCLSLPGALAPTLIAETARLIRPGDGVRDAMAHAVNLNVGIGSALYLSLLVLFSFRIYRFRQQ